RGPGDGEGGRERLRVQGRPAGQLRGGRVSRGEDRRQRRRRPETARRAREEPGRGTDAGSPVRGDAMKSRLFVVAMLLAVPAWAAAPAQPDKVVSVSVHPTTMTLTHHRNPH